jgi:predicted transcriptional regulator
MYHFINTRNVGMFLSKKPYIFYSTLINKKDMKYRSRTEIVVAILEIASQGTTKTRIMYKAYLSYSQLNQYMSFLIENKLIERKLGSELYTLTEKGRRLLHVYQELNDMIPLKKGQTKFLSNV